MSDNKETLSFKIGLSGTFWEKVPAYQILIDGVVKSEGSATEKLEYIEFEESLAEDQDHLLEIRLTNKTSDDTIENSEKTAILKDLLLNIESIEIDDIEIGDMKWKLSEFVGDDLNRPVLKNCVNLGWNGSYQLKFTSPFYLWLLENM